MSKGEVFRRSLNPSFVHPCSETAAIMPYKLHSMEGLPSSSGSVKRRIYSTICAAICRPKKETVEQVPTVVTVSASVPMTAAIKPKVRSATVTPI